MENNNYIVINGVKYAPTEQTEVVQCEFDCDLYDKCYKMITTGSAEFSFCFVDIFKTDYNRYKMKKVIKED